MGLRVAFVGAGPTAAEHIRAFRALPDVEIAAIYSRTAARARPLAEANGIASVCESLTDLAATRADLVVVVVSVMEVHKVARACLDYPWTVLLEKPPAHNYVESVRLLEEARRLNRRVFVALNRRFYSATRAALAGLTEEPRLIHVLDQQEPQRAVELGETPEYAAHLMYSNSLHLIDYLRIFGRGPISRVQPILPYDPADPGFVAAAIKFESGDRGIYQAVWNAPGPWAVTVTNRSHRWELRPLENASFTRAGERRPVSVESDPADTEFKPGFLRQAEAAVLAARGLPSGSVPLEEAVASLELVERIYFRSELKSRSDARHSATN